MSFIRVAQAGINCIAEQKITCSGTAVYSLNSTVLAANADIICFSVETNNIRIGFGSSNTIPATSTGVVYVAGSSPEWLVFNRTSLLRFTAVSGTPIVNLAAFKYLGL